MISIIQLVHYQLVYQILICKTYQIWLYKTPSNLDLVRHYRLSIRILYYRKRPDRMENLDPSERIGNIFNRDGKDWDPPWKDFWSEMSFLHHLLHCLLVGPMHHMATTPNGGFPNQNMFGRIHQWAPTSKSKIIDK